MILYHLINSNIPNTLPNAVRERFQFKQTFEFVSPYSQIWPPTSTNDSEHTDWGITHSAIKHSLPKLSSITTLQCVEIMRQNRKKIKHKTKKNKVSNAP